MTGAQEAATAALQAEYGAVYLYGVVDAYASPTRRADIAKFAADHRAQRDALVSAVTAAGAPVPAAAPAYHPPQPIVDPVSAATVAAAVEDDSAAAYRNLLSRADTEDLRRLALTGLGGAAVRGARWRVALGVTPATGPFPGVRG